MAISRRSFLGQLAAAGGVMGFSGLPRARATWPTLGHATEPPRPLRILILGGSTYLGPYQIKYALSRGHSVSTFNRGRTQPTLFPEVFDEVEQLIGDRNNDLEALRGREWDAVIDNSAHTPDWIEATGEILKNSIGRYLFTSSASVYVSRAIIDQDESGAIGDGEMGFGASDSYGALKAQCEAAGRRLFGDRFTYVRPASIVGPGDPIDLFTYWMIRVDRGGEMLAPAPPENPFQTIDVRDCTEFMIRLLEQDLGGPFNITGPAELLTFGSLLETMRDVSGSDVRFTWVDADFLTAHGVEMFTDLPLWRLHEGDAIGYHRLSFAKARAAGLTFRPIRTTLTDLLAWCHEQPAERWNPMKTGLSPEREREVLEAWHRRAA